MGLSLDGLASGLDTTALIKAMMDIERIPQNILYNKSVRTQATVDALKALNTRVADLSALSAGAAKPGALSLFTATSSSTAATAAAGTGAAAGSVDFTIDRLATKQSSVSAPLTQWPDTSLTITGANGTAVTVTAASTSLDDVVKAVNASTANVTATKISTGDGNYRLQLTSKATGAAGAFTLSGTAGTFTQIQSAQDAQITLWKGTAAEQPVTSGTNTFANLQTGLSVTVAAVSATPVTISVAQDADGIAAKAEALVKGLNDVLAYISSKQKTSTAPDANGKPVTTLGVFTTDSAVRSIGQSLLTAASAPIGGVSPSEYGISITKNGTMEFDAAKFKAALAKDPAAVDAAVRTIGSRLEAAGKTASDKYGGVIASKITSGEGQVRELNDQVANWDIRLASREARLKSTYAALEVAMQAMNAQSSWLTAQLATLPTQGSDGKK
ncbi:flagellar filament capping protein FliD [Arthrobacter sp. MSA 4-2]|uniref:flagellar filament capping protein FliD n=1 Tax=Arthrobacter sp. MSA 4-2 TaxID=2794349 RepID=UPI0018E790D7|nr:flagellar filament capping protein FliD [Arthrobacter sp. MSA 4-2]MBJ2120593.1 flagellar filament capping protein FliD [Arthrobacter sp. MSA 4-2]